ncbi:MAG: aminotransferase class I/II-fold pyridoxal phosphate-dependent enzyme [Gammaproteobacteria bacterium]|jgi:methionine-gamma-lyase|nr:aminotransferase class I/II-fold pyridoxal phosphate-dependent enzyme [Gammaproteobacteria bacterium]MBT5204039.1 aminotransferase class I/II-fold pyridoxal phosphate-dependent enzyme [Gammaproteobacteria bacterium]MBT5601082.1 aminotransferase class I/II-fold pyridoxal phosphate-dependent enzyme [Gammaproteobacteria bacterium]MBT6245038.1 aminotransferase class I/II-fold pyridoxal phosphate-dependent enzyme [Gammaproteobacteria bacterium]
MTKKKVLPEHGMGTIVNHVGEGSHDKHAHLMPIYQTSTFGFDSVQEAAEVFAGKKKGYAYTRTHNPNMDHLANKIAYMEGFDLIRSNPDTEVSDLVLGKVTSSGMAATSAAVLAKIGHGDKAIVQRGLYGNSFKWWYELAPRLGIEVIWFSDVGPENLAEVIAQNTDAKLIFLETPSNPNIEIIDLAHLVAAAHAYNIWVMVDNTFATPYHQRPLTFGCDVVLHSTSKYISGHGQVIGGAIVSTHLDYMAAGGSGVGLTYKMLGVAPSPTDTSLINVGLKTFELRMQKHAENALAVASWLQQQPQIEAVFYPGLPDNRYHELAKKQMVNGFGGMVSFKIKGGVENSMTFTNAVTIPTLAVSLGNVDSLIQHPASMTHSATPKEEREKAGIADNIVRLSVGIENIEDLIADLDQAMQTLR